MGRLGRLVRTALLLSPLLLITSCPILRPAGPRLEPFFSLEQGLPRLPPESYTRPPELYGTITSGDNLLSHPAICEWGGAVVIEDLLGSPQLRLFGISDGPADLGAFTPGGGYEWLETACLDDRLAIYQGRGMHFSLSLVDQQGKLLGDWSFNSTEAARVLRDQLFIISGRGIRVISLFSGAELELGSPGLRAIPLGWDEAGGKGRSWFYYLLGSDLYRVPPDLSRSRFVQRLTSSDLLLEAALLAEPDRLYLVRGGSLPLISALQVTRDRGLWFKELSRSFTRYRLYQWNDQVLVLGYTPAREGVSGARLESYSVLAGEREINYKFAPQSIPVAVVPLADPARLLTVEVVGFAAGEGWPGHDLPGLAPGPRPPLDRLHTVVTCLDEQGKKLYQLMPAQADFILPLNRQLLVGINLGSELRDASLVGFSTQDGNRIWQLELPGEVVDFALRDPYVALVIKDAAGNFSLLIYRFGEEGKVLAEGSLEVE